MAELLYVISSQLIQFIRADKFLLSMPLQHKFAKRYQPFYSDTQQRQRDWQQNVERTIDIVKYLQ
ncbi:hypothetical protein [Pedobacter segetis]|uniref:hypothetical protein n=1 Tax=Pedobacter segetis TaxID=2793069 RepID=UPI00190B5063|nr:hypothetical protein [Pedobacter segetis]